MTTTFDYGMSRALEFEGAFCIGLAAQESPRAFIAEGDESDRLRRRWLASYLVESAAIAQGVNPRRAKAAGKRARKIRGQQTIA